MMIAQGFSVEACTALSARSSRLSRAAEAPEVIRVHVTEAGRRRSNDSPLDGTIGSLDRPRPTDRGREVLEVLMMKTAARG
jgi:hypothetical protein